MLIILRFTKLDPFKKSKNQTHLEANKLGIVDMEKRQIRELDLIGKHES